MKYSSILACATALVASVAPVEPARAELVLSQLIIELQPGKRARQDIEIWNSGADRLYVAVEPREVLQPGTPAEARRVDPNPEVLGLLVSPGRIVLEPGQRKLLRVATIGGPGARERVYRITVKPVVGKLSSEQSGLKILVGYDVLVLVRPIHQQPRVTATRVGGALVLKNEGNVSVELQDGQECDLAQRTCSPLPGGRLYSGAEKRVPLTGRGQAHYVVRQSGKLISQVY